jgi:hypothetical protein
VANQRELMVLSLPVQLDEQLQLAAPAMTTDITY